MLNFINIYKRNAETFYDNRTKRRNKLFLRYVTIALCSTVLTYIFSNRVDSLYTGLITVQAILVGFSFNVMIFLASTDRISDKSEGSIERGLKVKRLNELAREIFYNLSYFNLIAFASIIVALALLMAPGLDVSALHIGEWRLMDEARSVVLPGLLWLLYAIAIESFATFVRVVQRSSYYFEQRVKLEG